jgi:hypothetical protein
VNQLVLGGINERTNEEDSADDKPATGGLASTGIIAIYMSIVLWIAAKLRSVFALQSERVIYTELQSVDFFQDLCNGTRKS